MFIKINQGSIQRSMIWLDPYEEFLPNDEIVDPDFDNTIICSIYDLNDPRFDNYGKQSIINVRIWKNRPIEKYTERMLGPLGYTITGKPIYSRKRLKNETQRSQTR